MKTFFKGLTEATITFNTLNMILHGPETCGIDIETAEQRREIAELESAELITVVSLPIANVSAPVDKVPNLVPLSAVESANEKVLEAEAKQKQARCIVDGCVNAVAEAELNLSLAKEKLEEAEKNYSELETLSAEASELLLETKEAEEVDDVARFTAEAEAEALIEEAELKAKEEAEATEAPKPVKRGRGRPKGSRNKTKTEQAKEEKPEDAESSSTVVVATPNGPVTGEMKKSIIPDLPDSSKTAASIEAMETLEAEEAEEAEKQAVIDEEDRPPNERMGNKAVISTGEEAKEITLSNSILPESEAIKNRDPFVAKPEPIVEEETPFVDADESVATDDIFIDGPVDNDPDDILGDLER